MTHFSLDEGELSQSAGRVDPMSQKAVCVSLCGFICHFKNISDRKNKPMCGRQHILII